MLLLQHCYFISICFAKVSRILRRGTGLSKRGRRVFVNLEGTERIYTKGAGPMCPRDGYVLFRNSELLCGRLGKQTLGGGNKASLFQARAAAAAMACANCD